MSAYADLSVNGLYELEIDLATLGPKIALGWLRMLARLKRFGSIPADERSVAAILGCSVRFLHERAWPQIEDRIIKSEDGRRYSCPEIGRARGTGTSPPTPAPAKKTQQSVAALTRWHGPEAQARRAAAAEAHGNTHAEAHGNTHADRMRTHAETHDFSMSDASETHAKNASETHGGASSAAYADSLSEQESSETSALERESGHAGADAPDMRFDAPTDAPEHAPEHAPRTQPDASSHAPADAPARKKRGSIRAGIPTDWEPSAEAGAHAERIGADLAAEARKFRNTARSKQTMSADWDASFLVWLDRGAEYTARQRNIPLVQSIPGDKPAPEPDEDTAPEAIKLRQAFGDANYRAWLREMVIGETDEDGEMTVTVPSAFQRDYVRQHFADRLYQLFREDQPKLLRIVVEAAPTERRQSTGR